MGNASHLTKLDKADTFWPHVGRQIAAERYVYGTVLPVLLCHRAFHQPLAEQFMLLVFGALLAVAIRFPHCLLTRDRLPVSERYPKRRSHDRETAGSSRRGREREERERCESKRWR